MKKAILGILLALAGSSFAAPMSSTINLPVPDNGVIAPKGGEIKVPVSGYLISDVQYDVTCHVSNPNGADGIMLKLDTVSTYCPAMGGCGGILVNGQYPRAPHQVNLTQSDNVIQFKQVMTVNYDAKGALVFQNLDTTASPVVSNCVAMPTTTLSH